jgi:cerevisin
LAWNGGGISNYSQIIDKGGYKAVEVQDDVPAIAPHLELTVPDVQEIKDALEQVGKNMEISSAKFAERVEKMTKEIEDFVAEELKDFVQELPDMQ